MQRRDCNGVLCERSCLNSAYALCTRASAAVDTSAPVLARPSLLYLCCAYARIAYTRHCVHAGTMCSPSLSHPPVLLARISRSSQPATRPAPVDPVVWGPGCCIASSCPFSPRGRTHTRIACHPDVSSECESIAIAFLRQQRREEQLAEIAQSLSAPARSTGATDDSSLAPFDQVNQLCLLGQHPPQWCRGLRPRQEHSHLEQAQEGLLLAPSANVQEVCVSRYQAFVLSWLVAGTSHHLDPSLPSVCALRRRLEYRLIPCSRAERNLNDQC